MIASETRPAEAGERPADWGFLWRPRWILSHLFVLLVVALFVTAGVWQLNRHQDRVAQNKLIAARADAPALSVAAAIGSGTPGEVDFRYVEDRGTWLEFDLVRVANRSLNGVAGEWLVGLFETADGTRVLVNRGFVPLGAAVEGPIDARTGPSGSSVAGYLRTSRIREGISAEDTGEGTLVPRLNVPAVARRLDNPDVASMWLQLEAPVGEGFPELVPLPAQTAGPHLSYAGQWFLFASMGVGAYVLILRRIAKPKPKTVVPDFVES